MDPDKMKSSPPEASAPIDIPPRRSRASTVNDFPQPHPPSSRGPILPRSPSPEPHSNAASPPPSRPNVDTEAPLRLVNSLNLQVIRNQRGETLGLKVVDIDSAKPEIANVYAHLPIGKKISGLVFDVESAEAMKQLYTKASATMGSSRIMGILFAPPGVDADGIARDADWSFLDDDVEKSRDQDQSGADTRLPLHLRGLNLKD